MTYRTLTLALFVSMTMSGAVMAECNQPNDPEIPDGTSATGADMLKAKKAVEGYVSAAEEYMDCGVPSALQERMAVRMTKIVEKFNGELKAYKAKA